jgi:hypothetical protein
MTNLQGYACREPSTPIGKATGIRILWLGRRQTEGAVGETLCSLTLWPVSRKLTNARVGSRRRVPNLNAVDGWYRDRKTEPNRFVSLPRASVQ